MRPISSDTPPSCLWSMTTLTTPIAGHLYGSRPKALPWAPHDHSHKLSDRSCCHRQCRGHGMTTPWRLRPSARPTGPGGALLDRHQSTYPSLAPPSGADGQRIVRTHGAGGVGAGTGFGGPLGPTSRSGRSVSRLGIWPRCRRPRCTGCCATGPTISRRGGKVAVPTYRFGRARLGGAEPWRRRRLPAGAGG